MPSINHQITWVFFIREDMYNFFRIHPCITRQTLPFYQRPTRMECRTKKVSSFSYYCSSNSYKLSSYQLYDNAKYEQTVKPFDVKFTSILSFKQENLRPAWHCTDISNFYWTRPGWNKNILGEFDPAQ